METSFMVIIHLVPVILNTTIDQALAECLEVFAALTSASDEAIIAALACDSLPALQRAIPERPDLVVKCCCNLAKVLNTRVIELVIIDNDINENNHNTIKNH